MNGIPLIILIIFSAFTMNLTLQCALGIKGIAGSQKCGGVSTSLRLAVIFLAVVFLWFLFSRIISLVISGVFIYVLLFPLSFIIYEGLDFLLFRYIYKENDKDECCISFPGGITAAAVFICINVSNGFLETIVLSFGFTAGIFFVFLIIGEIRKRAAFENVPRFLRGKPLILITMGLLSLVFSTVSLLILRMIGIK